MRNRASTRLRAQDIVPVNRGVKEIDRWAAYELERNNPSDSWGQITIPIKRGTRENIAAFGANLANASATQRALRRMLKYTGEGVYNFPDAYDV